MGQMELIMNILGLDLGFLKTHVREKERKEKTKKKKEKEFGKTCQLTWYFSMAVLAIAGSVVHANANGRV